MDIKNDFADYLIKTLEYKENGENEKVVNSIYSLIDMFCFGGKDVMKEEGEK